ncbi:MAG TPA: DHH family phosphoesterase [Chitinophagaceae bacterium]|nr:DHH family phosphoesterase [Chitinophagaceae bacterium]
MQSIEALLPQLNTPQPIVITMHQKPDGDAMGSALGLYQWLIQLGHEVTVISPTNWANFLNWMPGCDKVIDFESFQHEATNIAMQAAIIFCLDFNTAHRTKHFESALRKSPAIKVLIDHHEQPDTAFFNYGVSITAKSSTCEMVYDFIMSSEHAHLLNKEVAACLYTGMMTDTGSFRFGAATASLHRAVAHLKDVGLEHTHIHSNIFDSFLENRLRFIGFALLNRMEVLYDYNTCVMHIQSEDLKRFEIKTGDTEGLVNYLLSIQGVRFGALVIDRDEERRWSFRSKGNFDVNTFARTHFEGGGHFNAAGGRSSDTLKNTLQKFKGLLPQYASQLQ